MRILFVADGRSPIALNWIEWFTAHGHEVHLASLYASSPDLPLASLNLIPVAFTRAAQVSEQSGTGSLLKRLAPAGLRTRLKQRLVPRTLPGAARQLKALIRQVQPDLVHAMRIPYEGMLAAMAVPVGLPLLISVWGNDFTLHAHSSAPMRRLTRQALQRADALHTDCHRDQTLAGDWGYDRGKPAIVLPGGGGVQLAVFYPPEPANQPADSSLTVINPRGLRAYVRNDTFFKAVPLVLARHPEAHFLCPAMAGESAAQAYIQAYRNDPAVAQAVRLLPRLGRSEMADMYRQAKIVVSITTHDGTPNTLLEALACGCFPIAGDIPSLREWITPGENGLLVDPGDAGELAQAILTAAENSALRDKAGALNLQQVHARAEYGRVMAAAMEFYALLIGKNAPVG